MDRSQGLRGHENRWGIACPMACGLLQTLLLLLEQELGPLVLMLSQSLLVCDIAEWIRVVIKVCATRQPTLLKCTYTTNGDIHGC